MSDFAVKRRSLNTIPTYSGTYELYGTASKGYMILKDSGTLTFKTRKKGDIFLLGAGGPGAPGYSDGTNTNGGGGGAGGFTKSILARLIEAGVISVVIGSGGTTGAGGYTQWGDDTNDRANGGAAATGLDGANGGSGGGRGGYYDGSSNNDAGNGGTDGANGTKGEGTAGNAGTGQGTTTKPFGGDVAPFSSMSLAGAGPGGGDALGGYAKGIAGTGGGGDGSDTRGVPGTAGTANTGGGGGGGPPDVITRAAGGSGLAIIRWGY